MSEVSHPTTPPLLIALNSPYPGAGKSVVARRLVDHHGFVLVKFAGVLKSMLRTFLTEGLALSADEIERMLEGDLKETEIAGLGVTPRRLMITLGTEWGRDQVRPDLWVHLVRLQVGLLRATGRPVVIDDMRFQNELDLVKEIGGYPVRVVRPGVATPSTHRSEGALDKVPMHAIYNDTTIADLEVDVDALVGAFCA